MVLWGHAPNSQTRQKEMKTAMEKLDMLVVVDPYPTVSAVLHDRTDGVYLLPAAPSLRPVALSRRQTGPSSGATKSLIRCLKACRIEVIMAKFANKFGWGDRSSATSKWTTPKRQTWKASRRNSTAACGPSATPAKALSG